MADHKDLKAATGISHSISGSWRKILFGGLCLLLLLALSALAQTIPLMGYKSGDSTWLLEPILSKTTAAWQAEVPALEPGKAVEGELAGGESHSYRLALIAGQFVHLVIEQKTADVVARLLGVDGQPIVECNRPVRLMPERILLIAPVAGDYRLELRGAGKEKTSGRYQIRIESLRTALPQDESRVAADRALIQAEQLDMQGGAENRRKSIEQYEKALALWQAADDPLGQAETLNLIGRVYEILGDPRAAQQRYEQAILLFRTAGDQQGEANALSSAGVVYRTLANFEKALQYQTRSLELRRATGDLLGEAYTLHNLGALHFYLGKNQEALEAYQQSLALKRAAGDRAGAAATLRNMGTTYSRLGDEQRALNSNTEALQLARMAGDRQGKAYSLQNLGAIYSALGEPQKALDSLTQAVSLFQAEGDRRGEAQALHNTGAIYFSLGELKRSLYYYQQALPLRQALLDRAGQGTTLMNIGSIYARLGETQKALEAFLQALPLKQAARDRYGEAYVLRHLGMGYSLVGERQKALDYSHQSLKLSQALKDRMGEADALLVLALLYQELNNEKEALSYYNQAIQLTQALKDRPFAADMLYRIARFENSRGNLPAARTRIEAALNMIELVRGNIASQESRVSYFATKRSYYDLYIDVLMQQHQREPSTGYEIIALEASERAHARTLLETLVEAGVKIQQRVDPALLARQHLLQHQLNSKENERLRLLSGNPTEEQKAKLEKELSAILAQYQQVRAQIRLSSPQYASLTQPQLLNFKEIQQELLDEDTLLLEYSLGAQRGFLWAVTPTSIASFELPKEAEIETSLRRIYDLLTARNQSPPGESPRQRQARIAQADAEYLQAATALSQLLLGPVAAQLGKKRLLIVAEGALQYLPFGALPEPAASGQGLGASGKITSKGPPIENPYRPLIVDHEIVSLPSASVLSVIRRELAGRKSAERTVAVLADPVFTSDDPRLASSQSRRTKHPSDQAANSAKTSTSAADMERAAQEIGLDGFRRLHFSRQEAEEIVTLASDRKSLKAVDFAANKTTATSADLSQFCASTKSITSSWVPISWY